MSASEPSRPWQTQKHKEILNGESPTAFAQLAELALPHLVHFLQQEFHQAEPHLHETAAIDALLTYHHAPQKYNPDKLTLFAYLRMAARHDLLNALDKQTRLKRPLTNIDEPAIQSQLIADSTAEEDTFSLAEWLGSDTAPAEQTLVREFESTLTSTDRQLFLLLLNGMRDTEPYAEILQIAHIPISEQRREVKRAKDRLTKSLTRFVNRHKA